MAPILLSEKHASHKVSFTFEVYAKCPKAKYCLSNILLVSHWRDENQSISEGPNFEGKLL